MGDEIKVNGSGGQNESPEELQKKKQLEQQRAEEQNKTNTNNELTSGLSGTKVNTNLNSGLGFGGIFGMSQMNVDQKELDDLSKSFLGFTMGASHLPFGMGESLMTSSINSWFKAFMGCFKGGEGINNDLMGGFGGITGGGIGIGGGKTTLIKEEDKVDDKPAEGAGDDEKPVVETPEAKKAREAKEAEDARKKQEAETAAKKEAADKKAVTDGDLTKMNREQFLKWLDTKGYKSEIGSDKDLIDYVDNNGNKVRVGFNATGQAKRIIENNADTMITYSKDGSKSIEKRTTQDERYSYTEITDYDKDGNKKAYKMTERDAGNYFKREWVGASGVEYNEVVRRSYNLTKPIEGIQGKSDVPEFKSGNAGYVYDPQKGTLDGKDTVFTKLKEGGFSAQDKKTGATYHYDKDGKLTKQIDPEKGIIRDFHKDGSYDEHYNRDWVKKK